MKTNPRMYWTLPYIVPPTYELPTEVSPMARIMEDLKALKEAAHPSAKKKRPAKKEKSTKPRKEKKKPKKKKGT